MLDNIEKNTEDQTDPFAKYGGKKVVKNEDPFAKYGGAILKKKESSQPTSQQKQQASKSQQQEQPTSSATGQQQNQQASATSDGVTKDEGNWFDKSMSYVTGIASEGVKSVFQKADDALNASKNYLKSEGFFDDGKVPDSPKSITDYFLNAADKYKDLGTKEVISNILPLKEAEIAMKIINSSMPQEQKNNVLKTINLASTKIKAGIGHIEEYQKYVLPEHNIPTNVLLGMASIAPDLIAAEVMGPASAESKLAAWGEKATENASTLVKKYAPKALKFVEEAATGNFTKIMAAEGAAKAAANTKEGENLYVNTLKGGIEGELEGMYMHGLGVASGKVMPSIAKGIARSGVNSEIATAIANPLANAGVFATAKALRTGIEKKRLLTAEELGTELGTGIGFSLLHAGSLYKNHNEINHYYDNVLNDDNLGSFSRVINETKDNLKAAYNPKLTDVDVKELTDARDELKAAILKEPDLNNKQILGDQAVKIQNQLDAHSAINGIVKDKDAIVKLIESNNEIPEEDRTRYVAKINAIADTFDMSEMAVKKREFDSKMEVAQSELDKANQEFNAAVKPSEKIAAKVKVDNARKTLDDLNTELTTFIKEAPVAGTPDQISKPIELSVEPKPIELKSPIELKEGEELIDVKEDGKGKTYTYTAKSTEKDGALAPKEKSKNFVKSFFSEDVVPRFKSTAEAVYETSKAVVNALSPKTGVDKGVVTKFYELTGDRNKSNTFVDKIVGEYEKTFDKMTTVDRVEFVDRMKAGKAQATPELDVIAKVISRLDKDLYDEITKYSPNLAWKENHFRVLWKKVPGKDKEKFWSFLSKRPLRGTQGFFKQSTLSSMTEGIAKGGEPHSTNPITMFKLAYDDSMKFITSQRIITALKKDGVIKFVKSGEDVPEGFTKINDNVANVYFKSDSGMVKTGEYYIQEGPGRMLNNMLSRDMVRDSKAGQSLMNIKNLYTQVELGLSPFHAVAISLEQIASGAGIGFRKIVNLGDVKRGIKDILTAPFSPKTTFSLGRDAFKFATVKDFENSKEGKEFLKRMPEAAQYVDDFFKGGGLMKQHEELKSNTYKALKESMGKDNYIGAALRALPAMNEGVMNPLFNVYIPSLKIGLFMKEFPLILAENKSRLDKGTMTREELSRKVIDSIDNRLGEMNFDNLYWNKTFKTSMQFMLRSVTWKLGNIRQMGGAAPEQAIEFYNAIKEKRRPNLSPKMAWLFGLSLTQVVLSSIIQGMSLDDDDKNKDIKDFKDIVAPRINSADDKERVVIPTYYKDLLHFWHAPTEYVSSGVSGPFGKGLELYKNKDFYGYEIYDETDPKYKQLFDAAKHSAPEPFSISSFKKMRDKGEPVSKQALSFLGFNKAPGYLEHSDLESEIIDLYRIRNTSVKPLKMKEANDKKKEIRDMYKKDIEKAQNMADEAVNSGLLRPTQVSRLFRDVAKNEDAIVYFFQRLPETDKEYIYSKMTKEEKAKFDPKNKLGQSTEASVEGVYE